MPATTAERYRRWFEYERDSHRKVLGSLRAVNPDLRSAAGFQKAIDLLAHIVAARLLWLYRFGAAPQPPADVFPRGVALANVESSLQEMEGAWARYLDRLTDPDTARLFEYRSLEGDWFRNTVEDILTQLFGHSLYHRGQIAQLLRSIGAEPPVTDFVFWTRAAITERRQA